jgi:hypothetical protein
MEKRLFEIIFGTGPRADCQLNVARTPTAPVPFAVL